MKRLVVLGGSTGIGYACAKLLKNQYAEVILVSREESVLRSAADSLKVRYVVCDCTNEESVDRLLKSITTAGQIDCIFCVGRGVIARIQDTTLNQWNDMIAVNASSAFLFFAKFLPRLYESQTPGQVIVIGSEASVAGFPTYGAYCAAKFPDI